jgi:hypothetical protein
MKIHEVQSFESLKKYLENFMCWRDEEHIYDFGGVVSLFLALLDNMHKHGIEGDLGEIGGYFTEEQREFLKVICKSVENYRDV